MSQSVTWIFSEYQQDRVNHTQASTDAGKMAETIRIVREMSSDADSTQKFYANGLEMENTISVWSSTSSRGNFSQEECTY